MPTMQPPKRLRPRQHQRRRPGVHAGMMPRSIAEGESYRGSGKLSGKVAIITGGDSGIGRAVAIAFAKEGAHVAIAYLNEQSDANTTAELVQASGGRCLLINGDLGDERHCQRVAARTYKEYGRIDILVNNAAEQHPCDNPEELTAQQIGKTFRTNVFAAFHLTRAALAHMGKGAAIINTTSVTAYRGSAHLIDYSATKGALMAFTRSLALALVDRGIRVNAVAPGPIWTPLIVSTFSADEVARFGSTVPMGRAGQPDEVAPSFVFLASADSSFMTGQVIHPNGGEVVNG